MTEEDAPPTKKKRKHLFSKSVSECSMLLTFCDDLELTLKTFLPMKDPSKPDGKAVNADGTLKAADQIKWLNSPTDELHLPNQAILGLNENGREATEPDKDSDLEMQDSNPEAKRTRESSVTYRGNEDFDLDMYLEPLNVEKDDIEEDDDPEGNGEDVEDASQNGEDENEPEEDENTGKEEDNSGSEEEDIDEDADKRYWDAKGKEGVRKVSLMISETVNNITKQKKHSQRKKVMLHEIYGSASSTMLGSLMAC